ncbi:MAG TPA: ATP-binding cassette domain-containing protein, partial [Candidatus Saccharimonadales bacterium]
MLKVSKLSKSFKTGGGTVNAVDNISFEVANGKFASIVGRSGSGKSTLLSLLGGLDQPTSGEIKVDDEDIANMSDHAL